MENFEHTEHLVVMDMQVNFLKSKPEQRVNETIEVIINIVKAFEAEGKPITYVMYKTGDFTPEGPIVPQLQPSDSSLVVSKQENDAFSSEEFLRKVQGAQTIVLVGCNMEFCVKVTAESAEYFGHRVTLYRNGILARDEGFTMRKLKTILSFVFNNNINYTFFRES